MARTLTDVRMRCAMVDDHWVWKGATSDAGARIYAPDLARVGAPMATQTGLRAVWQLKHGKAIPAGHRVFRTCSDVRCLNPEHMTCEAPAARGQVVAAAGVLKGQVRRIVANRAINRARSRLTPELLDLVRTSGIAGTEITRMHGIGRTTISRVRRGKATSFEPVGGLFTGLLRASSQPAGA